MFTPNVIFAIVIVIAIAFIIVFAVRVVPQGFECVVERFGRYQKTLKPGLNIIIPIMDRVANKMNMKECVLNVSRQEIISKDNASVEVDGVAFFQVLDAKRATYTINNLVFALDNLIITNIRTVLGAMDLDEMLSNRDAINAKLLRVLDEATDPWGVKIVRVEIRDIQPPKDLLDSMAKQMKAEREKRAEILKAEGIKQSNILQAEGQKQSEILKAEGEKRSLELNAEGEKAAQYRQAEANERLAEAEAAATGYVSKAISEGRLEAIQFFIAQDYIKALGNIASADNSKTIMMPVDSSGIIGSVGGISELLKQINLQSNVTNITK
ncbi:SPFH/Band 7/PHB domain protein [Thiotrichales bacterium 19X7-9]|nr:SPFH/Band 7/PHB domain protein [Thiotrichales bacterium 19X7-9]